MTKLPYNAHTNGSWRISKERNRMCFTNKRGTYYSMARWIERFRAKALLDTATCMTHIMVICFTKYSLVTNINNVIIQITSLVQNTLS
jgi:hypothetical protein